MWLRAWLDKEREAVESGRKRIYDVWPRGVPLPPPSLFYRYGYDEQGNWIGDGRMTDDKVVQPSGKFRDMFKNSD